MNLKIKNNLNNIFERGTWLECLRGLVNNMFLFVEMGEGGRGVNMKIKGPGRVKSSQVYGQM